MLLRKIEFLLYAMMFIVPINIGIYFLMKKWAPNMVPSWLRMQDDKSCHPYEVNKHTDPTSYFD